MKLSDKCFDLLDSFSAGPQTTNEAITRLYQHHMRTNQLHSDWKYYLQLNKLVAPLERAGHLRIVGWKRGETGHLEKVWELADFSYPVPQWVVGEIQQAA